MATQGGQSKFRQSIADFVCDELSTGKSLRAICRENQLIDAAFPDERTVRRWVIDDIQGFAPQYTQARDLGLDAMADEVIEIADTPQEGTKTKASDDGYEETTGDMIEHRRLRFQARQWYLSKLAPKRYGERLHQELTGANGAALNAASVSDAQLTAALNALAHSAPAQHNQPFDVPADDDDATDLV